MRDIRSDLQERANIIGEQLRAAHAQFEQAVQRLQSERDARIADLQGAHAMINKLIEFESGRMGDNVLTLENPPASQPSLADRIRAVNAG
jgi:hypothetical protein